MKRNIAMFLIIVGFLFAGWNGYFWAVESFGSKETLGKNDIVAVAEAEKEDLKPKIDDSTTGRQETPQNKEIALYEEGDSILPSQNAEKEDSKQSTMRDYKEYNRGDEVGWLLVPSLGMKYPIYWGTDDETLTQGVGYHVGDFTTPPDGFGHTVLSGHRDTVFQELGELAEGAQIYVQFEEIQYEYKIQKTWITDAEDRTVIVNKDEPTLTLTTCYPFRFIGSAPDRYIIEALLVNTTEMPS
ncbi:class D sortase [Planococcus soli]|uniref:class D sortase n=1 Tax=Planococcus soli TaxID=2666072 RepID=UPI00115E0BB9|nr:class D sortase [Planococcus soli]